MHLTGTLAAARLDLAEWQLDPTLLWHLHQLLMTLSIALFTTCHYTQLPRFLSLFPNESAVGVEARSRA